MWEICHALNIHTSGDLKLFPCMILFWVWIYPWEPPPHLARGNLKYHCTPPPPQNWYRCKCPLLPISHVLSLWSFKFPCASVLFSPPCGKITTLWSLIMYACNYCQRKPYRSRGGNSIEIFSVACFWTFGVHNQTFSILAIIDWSFNSNWRLTATNFYSKFLYLRISRIVLKIYSCIFQELILIHFLL